MSASPQQRLVGLVKPYLNRWEDFYVTDRFGETIIELRTNIMVHRKNTAKSLFTHQSFMSAMSATAVPNIDFIREWLKNARKATQESINKGEYYVEKLINGEWQSVKAHFNQWIYYDRSERLMYGKVKGVKK